MLTMLAKVNRQLWVTVVTRRLPQQAGFTIIELLVTTFIIGTVVTGLFGLFVLNLRASQEAERRVVAIALGNERMEMIRNLPYANVGTTGGIPSGTVPQQETITRNGQDYTVTTDIRYVDDSYDGILGQPAGDKATVCHQPPGNPGGQQTLSVGSDALDAHLQHGDTEGPCPGDPDPNGSDLVNTDYKQVRVEVKWPSHYALKPVLLISYIVPQGIEGGDLGGTLDFKAQDASGEGVAGATMQIINETTDPAINITTLTDSTGRVVWPGLPEASDTYQIVVGKSGYTSEQTYDATASFIPDTNHGHLSMILREVTPKTFEIDRAAALVVKTQNEQAALLPAIEYRLFGTKTIGVDSLGEPVYVVNSESTTDSQGQGSHTDMLWDTYDITVDGAVTGYDIKDVSVPLPFTVNPADDLDIQLTLVPHTPASLHVFIVDASGAPITDAAVSISSDGYDEAATTGLTGQVLFGDIPSDGTYNVTVEATDFETIDAQAVVIAGSTRVRFALANSEP